MRPRCVDSLFQKQNKQYKVWVSGASSHTYSKRLILLLVSDCPVQQKLNSVFSSSNCPSFKDIPFKSMA